MKKNDYHLKENDLKLRISIFKYNMKFKSESKTKF